MIDALLQDQQTDRYNKGQSDIVTLPFIDIHLNY